MIYDVILAGLNTPVSVIATDPEDAAWQGLQLADDFKTFLKDIKPHGQETTRLSQQLEHHPAGTRFCFQGTEL